MSRHYSIAIAAAAFALAVASVAAQEAEAAPVIGVLAGPVKADSIEEPLIEVRGSKGHGFKKHGFKRHGFKRHGFKHRGFRHRVFKGHGFGGHGFGGHGFKRHGFAGHKFGGHGRSFGGKRFSGGHRFVPKRSLHSGSYGHGFYGQQGYGQQGYSGPRIVTVPSADAPSAGSLSERGAVGESFPTKPLIARGGNGYVMPDQVAGNDVTIVRGTSSSQPGAQQSAAAQPNTTPARALPSGPPSATSRLAEGPTPVPAGCQRVSKVGQGDNGQSVRIGGTLCFEPNGQGFIVEGSRFVMDRL